MAKIGIITAVFYPWVNPFGFYHPKSSAVSSALLCHINGIQTVGVVTKKAEPPFKDSAFSVKTFLFVSPQRPTAVLTDVCSC